jgi:hypothetical protein
MLQQTRGLVGRRIASGCHSYPLRYFSVRMERTSAPSLAWKSLTELWYTCIHVWPRPQPRPSCRRSRQLASDDLPGSWSGVPGGLFARCTRLQASAASWQPRERLCAGDRHWPRERASAVTPFTAVQNRVSWQKQCNRLHNKNKLQNKLNHYKKINLKSK